MCFAQQVAFLVKFLVFFKQKNTNKLQNHYVLYENMETSEILLCFTIVFCFFGSRAPVWGPAGGGNNCRTLSYLSKNPISKA